MTDPKACGLDLEAALERTGGDKELLAEVAQMCLEDIPEMVDDIRNAIDGSDAQAMRKAAHKLKGSLVAVAAGPASEAAHTVEKIGAEEHLNGAAAALAELETEITRLTPALADFAASVDF